MPDPDARLRTFLGAAPPESVSQLPDDARAALADLLDEARRRQAEGLMTAFDATLKHVPFPLRKIVKKVLVG